MTETVHYLLPFYLPFMQKAFIISAVISVPMALLSCYLVLKGWSLMGDAISHAVFPGVVLAYMMHIPLAVGAFCAGMFCAIASGYLRENSRVKEDTILGIVFSGMFGVGLVLYVGIETEVHLDHILFGNMLGLTWGDVLNSSILAILIAAFIVAKRQDLLASSFDPQHARAVGLPTRFLHYALLAVISLAVVSALTSVGIILAIALLVTPGAIAHLLTRRFSSMLLMSVFVSLSSTLIGVYASFVIDSAPAPTIVLTLTITFLISFIIYSGKTARRAQTELGDLSEIVESGSVSQHGRVGQSR